MPLKLILVVSVASIIGVVMPLHVILQRTNVLVTHLDTQPDDSVIYLSGISLAILTPKGKER